MSVNIKIEFNKKILTLPINPEQLTNERTADNEKIKIVGLGNIVIKKDESLSSYSIESFFPAKDSEFYTGTTPVEYIDFINEIWKSDKVAKIVTEGLPINLNMYFVIDSFNYDHRAGEEEDIYYQLDITKYVPYGVKTIAITSSNFGIMGRNNRVNNNGATSQTYTVVVGDSLIGITQKLTGNTSGWRELYELNKGVIGNNPNLIYPGQVLTLPAGWVNNGVSSKSTNAKKTTSNTVQQNTTSIILGTFSNGSNLSNSRNPAIKVNTSADRWK